MRRFLAVLTAVLMSTQTVEETESAKILSLISHNAKSHYSMYHVLLKELASRGHQVTAVGHFPLKNPVGNYTDIGLEGSLPRHRWTVSVDTARGIGYAKSLYMFWQFLLDQCERVFQHPNVKKLIETEEKFDLIITHLFGPDCFLGFAHHFNAPLISLASSVSLPWANGRIGNPDNPAYIPNYFLPFIDEKSFWQRIVRTVFNEYTKLGHYVFSELSSDKIIKKHFGGKVPPIAELKARTSLVLVNSHFSLNTPRPVVPAFVEVAGMHIQSGGNISKDVKNFLDKAHEGVIYFSLGSTINSETFPTEKMQVFFDVFSRLPQKILWKMENVSGLPKNIMIWPWLPQLEILCHPNVRAFITHGGLFGTQEAVYAGVPMIGIPFAFDQKLNIQNYEEKGIAFHLDYDSISRQTLSDALDKVLNDPSYRRNAKKMSELFRDRPQTALETAIYWTEYVIRHRGAPHLRSAAANMPWYQYLLLDVVMVLSLALISILVTMILILKQILKRLRTRRYKTD